MLFPIKGNAFNANALQFLEQLLACGDGVWCEGLEAVGHEELDLFKGQFGQQRLAVRRAVQRKRDSNCGDSLKAVWDRNLINKEDSVFV